MNLVAGNLHKPRVVDMNERQTNKKIMKKRITKYIAAAMLLTALTGAAWIVSEVFTTQPEIVSQTAVDMDQTLTVLP